MENELILKVTGKIGGNNTIDIKLEIEDPEKVFTTNFYPSIRIMKEMIYILIRKIDHYENVQLRLENY